MTKNNLFLFLMLATTSTSAFATLQDLASEYSPIQPIKEITQKTIELSGALSGTLEKSPTAIIQEQLNEAFNDDKMLEFYLSTPMEKRQYLFPMIHIAPFQGEVSGFRETFNFYVQNYISRIAVPGMIGGDLRLSRQ